MERPRRWLVVILALAAVALAAAALNGALRWYGHVFAEVLVDPDAVVSGVGSPAWKGMREGLKFPDRVLAVDDVDLTAVRDGYPGRAFDAAIDHAAADGHTSVRLRVETSDGIREIDMPLRPFGASEWWAIGGLLFLAAGLYVVAAITALVASPRGTLARTFAKTALLCAMFAFTMFDFHTTRTLVPLMEVAFGAAPIAFVGLALRLPDDAPILARFPWAIKALDLVGLGFGVAMLAQNVMHVPTAGLRSACTMLFAASQVTFVTIFLVRFFRAKGERRQVMRALIGALAPIHLLLAVGVVLSLLTSQGSSAAYYIALPVLSFTPLSAVFAFLRHDLWGSRALVSRVVTLSTVAAIACVVAVVLATMFTTSLGVPVYAALLGTAVGGVLSGAAVTLAMRLSDKNFFRARAEYKPAIQGLSENLTSLVRPADVVSAIETTVRRSLVCDDVQYSATTTESPHTGDIQHAAGHEMSLPVSFRGVTIGVLEVRKRRGGAPFTSDDLALLRTIANQAAVALAFADAYAELEERRKQQASTWKVERLALIETMAAEIAHEVRYPINFFRSIFKRGPKMLDSEEVDIGCEEVDRLERLVSGLKRLAHQRLKRSDVRLVELADRIEVLLKDALGERALEIDLDADVALRCDVDQTTQVLVNLISNAIDAAGPDGHIGLRWEDLDAGGRLVVWDTGPGFEGDAAQLFAPWFTTKPRGNGLGLAIAQRIVRAHGWSIDAKRDAGRTMFMVTIGAADVARTPARRLQEHADGAMPQA